MAEPLATDASAEADRFVGNAARTAARSIRAATAAMERARSRVRRGRRTLRRGSVAWWMAAVGAAPAAGDLSDEQARRRPPRRGGAIAGVDGVLAVTPYYDRPVAVRHRGPFRAIAEATSLPVILYPAPTVTPTPSPPDDPRARLHSNRNVIVLSSTWLGSVFALDNMTASAAPRQGAPPVPLIILLAILASLIALTLHAASPSAPPPWPRHRHHRRHLWRNDVGFFFFNSPSRCCLAHYVLLCSSTPVRPTQYDVALAIGVRRLSGKARRSPRRRKTSPMWARRRIPRAPSA